MVQSIIDIGEKEDKILNIVKAQHGLKNKSQAVSLIAKIYAESFLESELRPEYLEKLVKIKREGYSKLINSVSELKKEIEV
ncbi:antitoxin [Candidatus Pacearchaeota archaeon CG10_big_fil_rev_8_21_14_0_10_34_76]|nr:MAG: antitoxin [Candidatus Pacearchaeota archaeon CG10_big_fil_rev_8_21_14_0_10_34_76]